MMKRAHLKRFSALLLLLAMMLSLTACGKEETQLEKTARYLQAQVPEPTCTAVGGDWLVFALARSGVKVPQKYFDTYYKNTEEYVSSVNGVLSRKKNTEYSRVILALKAIGKDPQNVAGYDLLLPAGDFDETVSQGVNGAIFALLALDSRNYEIPINPEVDTQATRELYVEEILKREIPTGGWALTGGEPDCGCDGDGLAGAGKVPRGRGCFGGRRARRYGAGRFAGAERGVYLVGRREQRVRLAGDRCAHGARHFSG